MQLVCPMCGASIPAESINLDRLVAKCPSCANVFSFADKIAAPAVPPPSIQRQQVSQPRNFTVYDTGFDLTILRPWYTATTIPLVIFAVIWNGFMFVWYTIALTSRNYPMAMFGSLHLLIGLLVIYAVVCAFINKTTITVTQDDLTIRNGPLPGAGNVSIKVAEIKELFCREQVSHSSRGGISVSYEVKALTTEGDERKLLTLDSAHQGLYIEQEIERFLKLTHQPVTGEYIL